MTEHEVPVQAGEQGCCSESDTGPEPAAMSRGLARRQFGKAVVGAAPVLMTLSSRPVWAWNKVLCASQLASGNLSGRAPGNCTPGHGCSWWKVPSHWNPCAPKKYGDLKKSGLSSNCKSYNQDACKLSDYVPGSGTTFYSCFGRDPSGCPKEVLDGTKKVKISLREIFHSHPTSPEAYFCAALMNACSTEFTNYVFTPEQVVGLYTGALRPPSGMTALQCIKATLADY